MQSAAIAESYPKWMHSVKCAKCHKKHMHSIGSDDDFEKFSAKDTTFSCSHCEESFKARYHPCYFCGELSADNYCHQDDYVIYMCKNHFKEMHQLSSIKLDSYYKDSVTTTLAEDINYIYIATKEAIKEMMKNL